MKTRAIIMDLDGTAVDSPEQKLPTERLIRAVKKLQNTHYICSATGRAWSFAKPVIQSLGLVDPCIIAAGTQICEAPAGKILWQKNIDERALGEALEIFQKYPAYKLLYNDYTEADYFFGGVSPKDFTPSTSIYFLEQIFIPDALAAQIHQQLSQIAGITCLMMAAQKPGTRDLHVIHKEATKEHAVIELLQRLGIDKNHTIGVGDGHNDLDLFNAVGQKIAMGNAVAELKAKADTVIGDVKEDGLAEFFEKLSADQE